MKVLALFPVRNEEWILPVTLPQLQRFTDGIIALDGHSTDRSAALIRDAGGTVLTQEGKDPRYAHWRQVLLEEGRKQGGTHFVWLDADEAFSTNLLPSFRERLAAMKPGQKLVLDWLALWKSAQQVRVDDCVWSRNYKDFVFCDDGVATFDQTKLHEGRTPGDNNPQRFVRIPRSDGAVLHFQFTPFARFQMKQAYVRCLEWMQGGRSAWRINLQYAITRDDAAARTERLPDAWLEGMSGLESLSQAGYATYLQDIRLFFEKKGIAFFEPLDLWHVPELMVDFQAQMKRSPQPDTSPFYWKPYQSFKSRIRSWIGWRNPQ